MIKISKIIYASAVLTLFVGCYNANENSAQSNLVDKKVNYFINDSNSIASNEINLDTQEVVMQQKNEPEFNLDSAYFEFIDMHMINFINTNKKFPKEAKEKGIEICVPILYEIDDKRGIITNISICPTIVGGHGKKYVPIGLGIEEEALRVFRMMETWNEHEDLLKRLKFMSGVTEVCFP